MTPLKCRSVSTRLHDATSQKTATFIRYSDCGYQPPTRLHCILTQKTTVQIFTTLKTSNLIRVFRLEVIMRGLQMEIVIFNERGASLVFQAVFLIIPHCFKLVSSLTICWSLNCGSILPDEPYADLYWQIILSLHISC
jgi:hypothetical protein